MFFSKNKRIVIAAPSTSYWMIFTASVMLRWMTTAKMTTPASILPVASALLVDQLPPMTSPKHQRIFLIRHGETDWNMQGKMQGGGFDIPLNENGQSQARLVAQALQGVPFGLVASSHLQRARQTSDILCENNHHHNNNQHPPRRLVLKGFGEMRFGDFEGLAMRGPLCTKETAQRFQKQNDQMKLDKALPWPGDNGESIQQVETRAREALTQVLKEASSLSDNVKDDDGNTTAVGIVAHGRLNNVLLASLLKGDGQFFYKFHQENCCINVLDHNPDNGTFEPIIINYSDHMTTASKQKL